MAKPLDVKVTLLRGESKGFEQEDLVGVYQVGIGEQRTINELRPVRYRTFQFRSP